MVAMAIIVLVIFGICMISIGAEADYTGGELKVSALVCGIRLQLIPREKKPPKPKKEKPEKQEPAPEEAQNQKPKKKLPNLQLTRDEILELVRRAFRGLGRFGKVTVNNFKLHVLVGGSDPYGTAMEYGWLNTALSVLAPVCRTSFIVKQSDVQTGVDFTLDSILFDAALSIKIRLGQIFRMVFSILFGALGVLIKNRIRVMREKRHNPPEIEKGTEPAEETDNNSDNTDPGERKE